MKYIAVIFGMGLFIQASTPNPELFFTRNIIQTNHFYSLYESGNTQILDNGVRKLTDFYKDLYVIPKPKKADSYRLIKQMGRIVDEHQEHVLVRLPEFFVKNVSSILHSDGFGCGSLVHLNGEPITPQKPNTWNTLLSNNEPDRFQEYLDELSIENIKNKVIQISKRSTRLHSTIQGELFSTSLAKQYQTLVDESGRTDITVSKINHGSITRQKSVVVRIEGSENPEKIVILGSHLDSIARRLKLFSDSISPGADDNASGTASNFEIFRTLLALDFQPKYTIEIHAYAAEEVGLKGSGDIARQYKKQKKDVLAMLQLDMTLFRSESKDTIWFIRNKTTKRLTDTMITLAKAYLDNVQIKEGSLKFASSDHASWFNAGYPAVFPSENPKDYNPNIHTRKDTVNTKGISWTQAHRFAELGLLYILKFSGE